MVATLVLRTGLINDRAILGDDQMMRNGVVMMVGLFGAVAGLGACTSVKHIQPGAYLEDNAPAVVWVTYPNNTVVAVAEPVVKRDTLRGILQGERVKIPLGEIRSVQ